LEARASAVQARYCAPGFFDSTDADEVARLKAEEANLAEQIERLTEEWERVEEELSSDDV
jgi:muconolactone delta-isomerase